MKKPILVERFADNGAHSHYDLVDKDSVTLWTGAAEEWKGIEERARQRGLTQGLALSVNYLLRGENAQSIWSAGGMTIRECIAQQVDSYDLDRLIPEFATTDDAEAIANYYSRQDGQEHIDLKVEADEFLTDLNESLQSKGELEAALIGAENKETILQQIQLAEDYIASAKEVYIEIVKTPN